MSPLGLPDVDSGFEWGARVGLAWQPFSTTPLDPTRKAVLVDPATGKPLPLPPPDGHRDAWGVPRSWGWATAEMFAINWGASMFNEYVRDANFNQISPRSFWSNFEEGFTYDDNKFKTNQLIHPFNGSTYYNAARANGIGFWGSLGDGARRRLRLGVLRRDAPDVVQRHDLDRLRRHRPRRGRPPHLLADPRQHQARHGTLRRARPRRSCSTRSAASTGCSRATRAR